MPCQFVLHRSIQDAALDAAFLVNPQRMATCVRRALCQIMAEISKGSLLAVPCDINSIAQML